MITSNIEKLFVLSLFISLMILIFLIYVFLSKIKNDPFAIYINSFDIPNYQLEHFNFLEEITTNNFHVTHYLLE